MELYIDNKEEIEDSPLRAISSISDTESKTDERIAAIKSPPSSLLELEAVSRPLGLKIKKKRRVSAKIIQLTAFDEKNIEIDRRHRVSNKSDREQGFTLIAGIFKDINLLQAPLDRSIELKVDQPELERSSENGLDNQLTNEDSKMQVPLKHTTSKTWQNIRNSVLAGLEHDVDRWNLKFNFNELEALENTENSEIELKGTKVIISDIRKNYFKTFTENFCKIAPNYTFKFSEVIK